MTASRSRRRALALTTAIAATTGLAFGLAAPASAVPAAVSSRAVSPAAASQSAHDTLPPAAAAKLRTLLKASPFSAESFSARESLIRSLSPEVRSSATAPQRRSVSPAAVNPAPLSSVAPGRVSDNAEPDWTIGMATVDGTLYGIGLDVEALVAESSDDSTEGEVIFIEKWTDFGWKRVPSNIEGIIQNVASYDGKLYITSVSLSRNTYKTQVTAYDGSTFTPIGSPIVGIAELHAAGSKLFAITQGTKHTTVATFTNGALSATINFDKTTTAFAPLGDDLYAWVSGSKSTALYRLSAPDQAATATTPATSAASTAPTATRVTNAPLALSGVEWNDALYFVGIGSTDSANVYRFDGTSAPTAVDTGVAVAKSQGLPAVGVYRGDLYIQSSPSKKHTYLYDFNGDATKTVNVGEISDPTTLTVSLLEGNGQLVSSSLDDDFGFASWVYDKDARQGDPVASSVPTVTGTTKVGTRVTAAAGDWTPTAALSYQWYSGDKLVKGAKKRYHSVTAADLGAPLHVIVTGAAFGSTASESSVDTTSVATGTIALKPSISGTVKAGKTVTAVTKVPKAAKQTYRWYRDGKPLSGATKSKYKITSRDAGHTLSVRVHATAAGYANASAKSSGKKVAR